MKPTFPLALVAVAALFAGCSGEVTAVADDFGFDGTCVSCHAGLSAGHVHANYKLRCVDCHGGNDQVAVSADAMTDPAIYRDPALIAQAHVQPKPGLARMFFANGLDDDGDGTIDEAPEINGAGTQLLDPGEVFEPQLHGEGPGEFVDTELSRDLNYARFINPGDLRVASVGCGSRSRGALEGGGGGGCHQQTVDTVRRSIMTNQSAVINGAYYGNESWRPEFQTARGATPDPRAGAFGYSLDYDGADQCIDISATTDGPGNRGQPRFDSACLETRAASIDPAVAAGAPGNVGLPAFEIAQNSIGPVAGVSSGTTLEQIGAGSSRYTPWGGQPNDPAGELAGLAPVPNAELLPGIPDPVDVILRTFRAYYPLNYPGSTTNFDFTFGTSILPEIARFRTANPYGRGHSSGCSACHAPYGYDGARAPTPVRQDDGTVVDVADPTTKHRELTADQDRGMVAGQDRLIGRAVTAQQQIDTGRAQQKTYSRNHAMTTKIDTDACGLCHGFVTRINLAYQGMAEEEQRDALARRKPIEFDTPAGTRVRILDSWVREDASSGSPVVVVPDGVAVIAAARQRDSELAQRGLIAGAGGCAQAVYTEDCNNNGELDRSLVLQRFDENGTMIAMTTVDEDANGNGALDLIDRLPRERAVDGRQMRYVYGGRNGSTRQMDVHFERGMHCIDCHFIQDVHGDGHVYSTNWDAIEIECEDCHGATARTTFRTSGPNGGNDLRGPRNEDLEPYFDEIAGSVIQRSRVTPGVFWKVPQTVDQQSPYAIEAHGSQHIAAPGTGSTFAGMQGQSELTGAKVECASCHSSWVHNCMGCHIDMNLGDLQRNTIAANGSITKSARENEVWLSNASSPAHINFQLLGMLRSPFVLGTASIAEHGRLAPFRSSMQAHISVTDSDGHTILDNATFTTFQTKDANSGRLQVATSAVAMNQTMPHTVRPSEARGCETCHPLVDDQGRIRNEHVLAQTYGLGSGLYPYVGDWAIAAGTGGLELFEHKKERELAGNNRVGASQRFPGMIINPADRVTAKVEPLFDGTSGLAAGSVANDVVLVRNFNPTPAVGETEPPSLRDLAIVAVDTASGGRLVVTDITARGHPTSARASVGTAARTFVLNLPAAPRGLAHLGPDVSDPFVYAAVGAQGVSVIRLDDAPGAAPAAALVRTVALPAGRSASDVVLAGDMLYVGTQQGTVEALSLSDPTTPIAVGSATIGNQVIDLAVAGFILYVATASGVTALALDDPNNPAPPAGTSGLQFTGPSTNGIAVSGGHVYAAIGAGGVLDIDMRTPTLPVNLGNIAATLAPGQPVNAVDVVVSQLPGQTWLLVLDVNGDLWGLKLDGRQSSRERCFPDPRSASCLLDLSFYDATLMSRDPSFDPITGMFDAADPSGATFFHQTKTILTTGRRLARPAQWEAINTLTGRRLRDSFMPGSGTLSLPVMQVMRSVSVCEASGSSTNPSGLSALGYAAGASCQPFGVRARPAPVCRPASPTTASCRPVLERAR
ncbi:MAG: hypothetical protein AB7O24_17290 [Kofleriaceae bacterium]